MIGLADIVSAAIACREKVRYRANNLITISCNIKELKQADRYLIEKSNSHTGRSIIGSIARFPDSTHGGSTVTRYK